MTKRGTKKLNTNNVATPREAVAPLLPYLRPCEWFIEPCAGAGDLVRHLEAEGRKLSDAFDIDPPDPTTIRKGDVLDLKDPNFTVITNPPFSRDLLMPILEHALTWKVSSWWLLPWDTTCNKYFAPVAPHVEKMVPIGRVSWMGNGVNSYENFGWIKIYPLAQMFFLGARQ